MIETRLQEILKEAIQTSATDIHFSFTANQSSIMLRTIYGLVPYQSKEVDNALYQYLKYLSKLDLAASMKPQSGTFTITIFDANWHCRFSAIETFTAKNGVIRILNLSKINNLLDLSFNSNDCLRIREAFMARTGLLLFSGSTGSGKSTTLFTGLQEISNRSIYTLEDPIECLYQNMMQIQINESIQLDFEAGIKQLLRHDPDILVIGEIRSPIEAKAAIRSCLSGHLVIATIHSSSTIQTLYRLLDFGCSRQELLMVEMTIVFQRLISVSGKRSAQFEIIFPKQCNQFLSSK